MKKVIFLILLLLTTTVFSQMVEEGTGSFVGSNLSKPIQLGIGFSLCELYLDTTYNGTTLSLWSGDTQDTTHFSTTYYEEDVLTFTVTNTTAACRVKFPLNKTTGVRNWKVKSSGTETCTFKWKAIYIRS